ncbi:putative GEM-like protein 8 isoform X2 [Phoenix dactylifera]|uniref:GEM-like protein 8 isoform X2 n=1 Tax=Phoenix dactylifera TaxID=42345 RepID=A0A8B9A824_PHODC|nr:putative GEM-like protein 8 isoform X2 [Phoenix dactylifera]
MKNPSHGHVLGIPVSSVTYAAEELPSEPASVAEPASLYLQSDSYGSMYCKHSKKDSAVDRMSKFSKKADNYVQGIREHVTLGPKITETMKGKLSLGARILQAGGVERVFRDALYLNREGCIPQRQVPYANFFQRRPGQSALQGFDSVENDEESHVE